VLTGSSRGTSRRVTNAETGAPPPLGVSISRGQILAIMLSVNENWVTHATGRTRDQGGRSPYRLAVRPWSPPATTQTPPEPAKPPSPDSPPQDARQTVLSGHVPNPRAEWSVVWLELYLRTHRQVLAGEVTLVVRRKHDGGPWLNHPLAPFGDSALPCYNLSFAHVAAEPR
jgi:hypothetical protein